ncbi:chaperonin 10-like protein [Leucosporidium creatinivorum]|uniref:Chaperonin 10-like protein n=1 Tax=Leucosporidium creatinivorum TaxID=106004 RepID=A0A1Y2G2U4_9BASI|nr:chaperonin 10-like protein [Leucosporidium creatinivorum]
MTNTHKALINQEDKSLKVQEVPLPSIISKGEVLVQVEAVALNPGDWKIRDWLSKPGDLHGCDFSGTVVELGEGVTTVQVGDRVASFVLVGSFAEHVKTKASLLWEVPDSIDWEQAAALGGAAADTAFQALSLRHGLPVLGEPVTDKRPFLVWAASTSVGMYAIQVAKLAGYTVIATASPKNEALVKSFGADAVYPYADESTPSKIAEAYPTLSQALDCFAEGTSTLSIAKSFSNKAGKIITLNPVNDETLATDFPEVKHEWTTCYTLLGEAVSVGPMEFPLNEEDFKAMAEWKQKVPELVASGKLKANPISHQDGGLESINDGLDWLKAGKVSAQKLTYRI